MKKSCNTGSCSIIKEERLNSSSSPTGLEIQSLDTRDMLEHIFYYNHVENSLFHILFIFRIDILPVLKSPENNYAVLRELILLFAHIELHNRSKFNALASPSLSVVFRCVPL